MRLNYTSSQSFYPVKSQPRWSSESRALCEREGRKESEQLPDLQYLTTVGIRVPGSLQRGWRVDFKGLCLMSEFLRSRQVQQRHPKCGLRTKEHWGKWKLITELIHADILGNFGGGVPYKIHNNSTFMPQLKFLSLKLFQVLHQYFIFQLLCYFHFFFLLEIIVFVYTGEQTALTPNLHLTSLFWLCRVYPSAAIHFCFSWRCFNV